MLHKFGCYSCAGAMLSSLCCCSFSICAAEASTITVSLFFKSVYLFMLSSTGVLSCGTQDLCSGSMWDLLLQHSVLSLVVAHEF